MHFHLPKPLHGWREFAGEVGIIVLGVLIALAAGQIVEDIHQRTELRDAEAAMMSELRDDDLPQAFTRAAIYDCYSNQLDAIEQAVASGDRSRLLTLARAYQPIVRTWDDQAWQAALASQVLVSAGSDRMLGWSTAYIMIPVLARGTTSEQDEVPQLWASISGSGPLSAAQQDRLFQIVSQLRRYNRAMAGAALIFSNDVRAQGLTLSRDAKAALLSQARAKYGRCVHEVSPEKLNMNGQITVISAPLGTN